MAKITYTNKVDNRIVDVPDINRVVAADMNEIKTSVNALYDLLDTVYYLKSLSITSADFAGSTFQSSYLVGKTPMTEFNVFTNGGSGTLLKYNDGYTFNSGTGTITMDPDNYVIQIYVKLT